MRDVRLSLAMSLDGYIAGPAGEVDWLPHDLEFDWGAFMARFDTVVMGRATWDFMRANGGGDGSMRTYVASRTVEPGEREGVTVVADAAATLAALRAEEGGKEIWLMGGGDLFAALLDAGQVDLVELTVIPVLLGRGIPFLPGTAARVPLELERVKEEGRGVVTLVYRVGRG